MIPNYSDFFICNFFTWFPVIYVFYLFVIFYMISNYLCILFIFYMIPNYLYLWFLEFEQALRFYFSVVIIN